MLTYFAYGSNLDSLQMRARCPSARVVARATLPGFTLTFGGYSYRWGGAVANVVRERGASVEGLLYRIDRADLDLLDRFEGCPFAYVREPMTVVDELAERRRAQVYLQPACDSASWGPAPLYLSLLRRAYARLGFDPLPLAISLLGCGNEDGHGPVWRVHAPLCLRNPACR